MLDDLEVFRGGAGGAVRRTCPATWPWSSTRGPLMMNLAAPWLPLARLVSAPAGRRYFAGFFGAGEIHVLARPRRWRSGRRACPARGRRCCARPRHEYAHVVVGANNDTLPPPFSPATFRRYVRSAWLCEGAASYLAGQVPHMRAAVARRLREGGRPQFPPASRDALVLGGTVFELLDARARRREACAELARAPDTRSPRRPIEEAFGRPGGERRARLDGLPGGAHGGLRPVGRRALQQRGHHALVELRAGAGDQLRPASASRHRGPVGPVAGHRVDRRRRPG